MTCNIHKGRCVTIVSIYDFLQLVKANICEGRRGHAASVSTGSRSEGPKRMFTETLPCYSLNMQSPHHPGVRPSHTGPPAGRQPLSWTMLLEDTDLLTMHHRLQVPHELVCSASSSRRLMSTCGAVAEKKLQFLQERHMHSNPNLCDPDH